MSLVSEMVRRASSGGLDKPAAALAALLAGAAVFAMPGGILQQAVLASGLPDSLPQLSPPLGLKARAGLGLLAAGSAFGMVLMAMRILAYLTNKRARPAQAAEGMPRVRRRDQHPDAPFRGPLSVSRDLGEPDAPPAPAPAPAAEREPAFVPAPWPEREQSAEPLRPRPAGLGTRRRAPLIEVLAAGGGEEVEPEPAPAPEEPRKIKAGREAEPVASRPPAPPAKEYPEELADEEPEPLVLTEIAEPEAEPEPEPVPVAIAQPAPAIVEIPAERPPAPQQGGQESLAQLLARFEQAVERKSAARAKAPVGPTAPAPAAEPVLEEEGMDLRLRSALENLRRFAPRHG
jgi:hypothetical protein